MPPSPPIVIFSPLPPRKSGIAAYTSELLPSLCERRSVVLVCEEGKTPEVRAELPNCGKRLKVIGPKGYAADPSLHALHHVYQIGNNRDHVFVYEAFMRRPGVLVQHDFNLHYLLDDATLGRGDAAGYRRIMVQEYGDAGATLADLRQVGVFSEAQKLLLTANRHLMSRAPVIIVHNRWVQNRLPADLRARTRLIPHHFSPLVDTLENLSRHEARVDLGLSEDEFIVLSLGFITPPKQIQATLAALEILWRQGRRFRFIIAGERNGGMDIDELIRGHQLEDCVTVTGYVAESEFFSYIAAADCLVNLRHPTVGESSGTLARALALGLPAIVHNFGPSSEYPSGVVLKVPLELGVPLHLAAALDALLEQPALRQSLSEAARRYMRSHCTVKHSAEAYLRVIDELPEAAP